MPCTEPCQKRDRLSNFGFGAMRLAPERQKIRNPNSHPGCHDAINYIDTAMPVSRRRKQSRFPARALAELPAEGEAGHQNCRTGMCGNAPDMDRFLNLQLQTLPLIQLILTSFTVGLGDWQRLQGLGIADFLEQCEAGPAGLSMPAFHFTAGLMNYRHH